MSSIDALPTRRTIVYIDGFNLYFGLVQQGWRKYLWLDVHAFGASILRPEQRLVRVHYFTSEISGPPDKLSRQRSYLAAVRTLPGVTIHRGRYESDQVKCPNCGLAVACPSCQRVWFDNNEKMTDVKIATGMIVDAFQNRYDDAILVSGDADQKPAIDYVRKLFPDKSAYVCFPPSRKSYHLETSATGVITAHEENFRKSQFPQVVTTSPDRSVTKPASWR
jgi:uncharacterized LabA/DUF88 family protein